MLAEDSRQRLTYAVSAGILLWILGNFLLLGLGLEADDQEPLWETLMFSMVLWGAQLVVCLIWAGKKWIQKLGISFRTWDIFLGFIIGIAAQLAIFIVYLPFLPLIDLDRISEPAEDLYDRATEAGGGSVALLAISTIVIAPVIEEIFFRGFIQAALSRYLSKRLHKHGPILALVITALIFAAVHFFLYLLLGLFFIGLILGYVRQKTQRTGLCICIHIGFNFMAFVSLI